MSPKTLPHPMTLDELSRRAVLSLPEAAALLGISRPHIYVMANRGEIPTLHLGARRVVSAPLLLQMLMTATTTEAASTPPETMTHPMASG